MENKLETRTKIIPGTVDGTINGKPFSVRAENLIHAIVIEENPPFTVVQIIMNFIIIQN
jgi:hypothetical protein